MKRIHLFEFEDLPWFPDWIRDLMTRYIMAFHRILGTAGHLRELTEKGLSHAEVPVILDLCSGSGGPMIDVVNSLKSTGAFPELKLILSDLYPNRKAAERIEGQRDNGINYLTTPMDATNVPAEIIGLRTMVSSLHHMKPGVAKDILKNASESMQPILVFEISDNSTPVVLWWLAIPFAFLATLFITPMVRPMTWQQLVFTYLIPILPLFIAWDGAVSNVRTYTLEDMDILTKELKSEGYYWEKGKIKGKGGDKLYLIGMPKI